MRRDLLDEALEAWEDAREGVIMEAENVPADRYGYRPDEDVRSVAELLVHIMEVSLMMVGELTRETTDFTRAPFPELLREHAAGVQGLEEKDELLEALRSTLDEGTAELRDAGELHMLGPARRFDGERGTRLAWLHHGQLCTYERLMGRVPALTKRIRGEE
ncbi:MAG: DinB family protein [Gemmatimonadota bacterium]